LLAGTATIGELELSDVQSGELFNVATNASGETVVTATIAPSTGTVQHSTNSPLLSGPSQPTTAQIEAIAPYAQAAIQKLENQSPGGNNEWFLAGNTTVVGAAPSFGFDLEVVGPVSSPSAAPGFGPGANITLAPGYHALIAEGGENINLLDTVVGNALVAGNQGRDTLVTYCNNDTLVGATGANTVFFATLGNTIPGSTQGNVSIQGGGNDTIMTTNDNALVDTSAGDSQLFLGSGRDTVVSSGHDEIVCGGNSASQINITAVGAAQDTVFGPEAGTTNFLGGAEAATVVGGGGAVSMTGGAADKNVLWTGSSQADYVGGAGSAIVVGGSSALHVQGGAGAITVWGGTGNTVINGTAGSSTYIVGEGASTISAATGNHVWLMGAANVSVHGADGVVAYGGSSTGNNTFQAAAGSETLWGGQGDDTFVAGNGQSVLVSGGGNDLFSFTDGVTGGTNVIMGFAEGSDTIALNGYGDTVPAISVHGGNSFLTLGDGSHLVVYGVTDLTSSAFHLS
jgi:Ca2+-binding RTX toxin-like protein